jgi:hypothetical protein
MTTSWTPPSFPGYRVLKRLAGGADLDVFEVVEEPAKTKRHRVIKALRPGARPEVVARLLDDARILQGVDERFGVLVEVDLNGDNAYLVLELPSGQSVADLVARGALSPTAALGITLEAVHAVSDLFETIDAGPQVAPFVCGALAPRSVLVLQSGDVRFVDLAATPGADFHNRDLDAPLEWAKTIAVGSLLHFMLAGRSAVGPSGHVDLAPELDAELRSVVERLVQRDHGRLPAAMAGLIWRVLAPRLSADLRSVLKSALAEPPPPRVVAKPASRVMDLVSDLFRDDLLRYSVVEDDGSGFEEKTAGFEEKTTGFEDKTQGFGEPVVVSEEDQTLGFGGPVVMVDHDTTLGYGGPIVATDEDATLQTPGPLAAPPRRPTSNKRPKSSKPKP